MWTSIPSLDSYLRHFRICCLYKTRTFEGSLHFGAAGLAARVMQQVHRSPTGLLPASCQTGPAFCILVPHHAKPYPQHLVTRRVPLWCSPKVGTHSFHDAHNSRTLLCRMGGIGSSTPSALQQIPDFNLRIQSGQRLSFSIFSQWKTSVMAARCT